MGHLNYWSTSPASVLQTVTCNIFDWGNASGDLNKATRVKGIAPLLSQSFLLNVTFNYDEMNDIHNDKCAHDEKTTVKWVRRFKMRAKANPASWPYKLVDGGLFSDTISTELVVRQVNKMVAIDTTKMNTRWEFRIQVKRVREVKSMRENTKQEMEMVDGRDQF